MGEDWAPASDQEKSLKDSFALLQTSITSVVKAGDQADAPSRFVLTSKGFYDVQAYVMSIEEFPQTGEDFEKLFDRKAFGDMLHSDYATYTLLRDTIVGLGRSSRDYYYNQLARLVNSATAAAQYAETTTDMLFTQPYVNLKGQLEILLGDRHQDYEFEESKEMALMICDRLKGNAEQPKRDIDDIRARLVDLQSTTQTYQSGVQKIIKQFKTGPVENRSNEQAAKKPYLEQLNAKYNTKVDETKKQLESGRVKSSDWQTNPDLKVGLTVWPGLGWIAMDVMAAQTAGLKNAYNGLVNTVNEESRENERDMRLVRYVTKLIEQCSDIDGKISSVIAHLGKVGELYGNHAACFEKIKSYLNSMDRGGKSDGGSNRRDFILGGLTKTEELLRELKRNADSAREDAVRQFKMD